MNRQEAQDALLLGKTLTHPYFTSKETVKGIGNGRYEFEDGCICFSDEFWNYRMDEAFNEGWREVI